MSVVLPIEESPRFALYTAAAGQTQFAVPFPFQQNDDIALLVAGDADGEYIEISPSLYSLVGHNDPDGGLATFYAGRVSGEKLLVLGRAVLDRLSSITTLGRFSSSLIDGEFDRAKIIQQELRRDIDRSPKTPFGETGFIIKAGAAGSVPVYDADGNLTSTIPAVDIALSQSWANYARQWATSLTLVNDGVNLQDYSAKYYANRAQVYVDEAEEAVAAAISFLSGQVTVVQFAAGVTSVLLPGDPGSVNNVRVVAGGIPQNPNTYSKTGTGPYSITFSDVTTEAGWLWYGNAVTVNTPADKSVDLATKLQDISEFTIVGRAAAGTGPVGLITPAILRDNFLPSGSQVGFARSVVTGAVVLNTTFQAPTSASGDQVHTITYTPQKIGNILEIELDGTLFSAVANLAAWGLFNAGVHFKYDNVTFAAANQTGKISGKAFITVASLSPLTITSRIGPNNGGGGTQVTLNNSGVATQSCVLTIKEFAA